MTNLEDISFKWTHLLSTLKSDQQLSENELLDLKEDIQQIQNLEDKFSAFHESLVELSKKIKNTNSEQNTEELQNFIQQVQLLSAESSKSFNNNLENSSSGSKYHEIIKKYQDFQNNIGDCSKCYEQIFAYLQKKAQAEKKESALSSSLNNNDAINKQLSEINQEFEQQKKLQEDAKIRSTFLDTQNKAFESINGGIRSDKSKLNENIQEKQKDNSSLQVQIGEFTLENDILSKKLKILKWKVQKQQEIILNQPNQLDELSQKIKELNDNTNLLEKLQKNLEEEEQEEKTLQNKKKELDMKKPSINQKEQDLNQMKDKKKELESKVHTIIKSNSKNVLGNLNPEKITSANQIIQEITNQNNSLEDQININKNKNYKRVEISPDEDILENIQQLKENTIFTKDLIHYFFWVLMFIALSVAYQYI